MMPGDTFDALRHPIRIRLVAAARDPRSAAELADELGVAVTGLYHHIDVLLTAGLLEVADRQRSGKAMATRYRATAQDFSARPEPVERTAVLRGILDDAFRDATASAPVAGLRIGRTVAAVPTSVMERVASLIDQAAAELRAGDVDGPDPLVSFTYVFSPLASPLRIRPAGAESIGDLRRVLYEAVAWDPGRRIPPYEVAIEHPELARYHVGWGRPGDLAVVAALGEQVIGGALCRRFTEDDHGHGYLDETTPELAIAVWPEHRGKGVGSRLLGALEAAARDEGFRRLSLSVDHGNPARRLYARCGYSTVSADDEGIRMAKSL